MKTLVSAAVVILLGFFYLSNFKGQKVEKIIFTLGSNIVETAKATGVPKFSVVNVDDLIQYEVTQLPKELSVVYHKAGYEIALIPVFEFSLYADRRLTKNDIVYRASITVESGALKSHTSARSAIDKLILQFESGKWIRHIPDSCPAVAGRSAMLNIAGELDSGSCALDPKYPISEADWLALLHRQQKYEWIGDGVHAVLTLMYEQDVRGLTYDITLVFEDYATSTLIANANEKERRERGDKKGWETSKQAEQESTLTAEKVKVLETNALKRGDKLVARGTILRQQER